MFRAVPKSSWECLATAATVSGSRYRQVKVRDDLLGRAMAVSPFAAYLFDPALIGEALASR
jgi:hypothetical protein